MRRFFTWSLPRGVKELATEEEAIAAFKKIASQLGARSWSVDDPKKKLAGAFNPGEIVKVIWPFSPRRGKCGEVISVDGGAVGVRFPFEPKHLRYYEFEQLVKAED